MVDVRTGWLLGLVAGASACFVPNPLFIATGGDGSSGDSSGTATDTTGEPGTAGTGTTVEPASTSGPGTTTMPQRECGNGTDPEPGEQCEDGNLIPGDGCEPNCKRLFRDYFTNVLEGSKGAVALAVADLDGAYGDDIILGFPTCANDQPCIRIWYRQEEDATFALAEERSVKHAPARLFVSDWDGDEVPDILATHEVGEISLLRSGDPAPFEMPYPGDLANTIVARVDDDAFLDLLIPNEADGQILQVPANGTAFTQPNPTGPMNAPHRLAAADVDDDGALDLLYSIGSGPAGFAVKPGVFGADLGPFTSFGVDAGPIVVGEFADQPWPNVAYAVNNTLQIFTRNVQGDPLFVNDAYTVATVAPVLVLRSVRLNTETIDNILALTTMGLQIFTYDESKGQVVAGTTFAFSETPIDFAPGNLGGDGRPDIAALSTFGCYVMINQSGE